MTTTTREPLRFTLAILRQKRESIIDPNTTLKMIQAMLFEEPNEGDYADCLELIESLAVWLSTGGFTPNDVYDHELDWSELLEGAYWYFVENHGGQSSDEYRVQCIIGCIYKPGPITTGPDTPYVYDALTALESN